MAHAKAQLSPTAGKLAGGPGGPSAGHAARLTRCRWLACEAGWRLLLALTAGNPGMGGWWGGGVGSARRLGDDLSLTPLGTLETIRLDTSSPLTRPLGRRRVHWTQPPLALRDLRLEPWRGTQREGSGGRGAIHCRGWLPIDKHRLEGTCLGRGQAHQGAEREAGGIR
jgi:hypothetical protein